MDSSESSEEEEEVAVVVTATAVTEPLPASLDPPRTQHEEDELAAPLEDVAIELASTASISRIGVVMHTVPTSGSSGKGLLVVQADSTLTSERPPLAEGSVLFTDDRVAVGKIHEIFGPVEEPLYTIRVNDTGAYARSQVVCCAADHVEAIEMRELLRASRASRSDASNIHDEPAANEEFSDDEAEMAAKKSRRRMLRAKHEGTREDGARPAARVFDRSQATHRPLMVTAPSAARSAPRGVERPLQRAVPLRPAASAARPSAGGGRWGAGAQPGAALAAWSAAPPAQSHYADHAPPPVARFAAPQMALPQQQQQQLQQQQQWGRGGGATQVQHHSAQQQWMWQQQQHVQRHHQIEQWQRAQRMGGGGGMPFGGGGGGGGGLPYGAPMGAAQGSGNSGGMPYGAPMQHQQHQQQARHHAMQMGGSGAPPNMTQQQVQHRP